MLTSQRIQFVREGQESALLQQIDLDGDNPPGARRLVGLVGEGLNVVARQLQGVGEGGHVGLIGGVEVVFQQERRPGWILGVNQLPVGSPGRLMALIPLKLSLGADKDPSLNGGGEWG